jgi:hypothetical protein
MDKKTRVIVSIVSVAILAIGTVVGVMLVNGYTIDTKSKKVVQTGVLVVNSVPSGAAIYIDDHYQNTTPASISFLPAKRYKIKLTKEGYGHWEKELDIDKTVIGEIEAILWPATPSVNPVTTTGVVNVKVSPDGLKAVYAVKFSEKDKAGLWVMDMARRSVFSGISTDFTQITRNSTTLDFSTASYLWSPDSKQILATMGENGSTDQKNTRTYLLDATNFNTNPPDVTLTKEGLLSSWIVDWNNRQTARHIKLSTDIEGQKVASDSATPIKWSYDNTMFLYTVATNTPATTSPSALPQVIPVNLRTTGRTTKSATSSALVAQQSETATASAEYNRLYDAQFASYSANLRFKVYNTKSRKSFDLPEARYYTWYPAEEKADRKIQHLIMVEEESISIIETDGGNKSTIYSGPFEDDTVFPWPDGGRLVILTNFNSKAGSEPNMYTLNLR